MIASHFSNITKKERKKERKGKKKLLPINDFYFDFYFIFLTKRLGNFWENELCSVIFD
jgi:hypothetical protein